LPPLVVDDAPFDWIKPIPKPPKAPASNPSSTSMGTLSRSAFFTDLAIFAFSTWVATRNLLPKFSLAFALPFQIGRSDRKSLRHREMEPQGFARKSNCEEFFT
jgi:hypothetical protein